jgi:hypothetical protein
MDNLNLEETQDTPKVTLNASERIFELSGRSLPEDCVEFFAPILAWVREYAKSPNPETVFVFKLEYFNTASSKLILDMLQTLKSIPGIKIVWYYYEDDEEISDAGREFAEQVDIAFEFKTM